MKISDHDMHKFEKLFEPVLEWLDVEVYKKKPKVGFDMTVYVETDGSHDYRNILCPQTVCVLGYIWKYNNFDQHRSYGFAIIDDIIEKFEFDDLEMVGTVLRELSSIEDKYGNRIVTDFETIKPYQVAAAIRYFLKTRKVKWKKFLDKDQISVD